MITWPPYVVDDIARRRAVLFLGAGVSRNSTGAGGRRPPTWVDFLNAGLSRCTNPKRHIGRLIGEGDLLTACELIKERLGVEFRRLLQDEFVTPAYQPARIHEHIFKLDVRVVATQNFDKIYDNYSQTASSGTIAIKNYYDDDVAASLRGSERVVLKVHGTIDQPPRMIFTRSEFTESRYKYGAFHELMDALAATHTFIFFGCSLVDPDIRLMLERHAHMHRYSRPHYLVMPKATMHRDVEAAISNNMNISVVPYDPSGHHAQLTDSVEQLAALVEARRDDIARTRDW